jgi:hypothetical protein
LMTTTIQNDRQRICGMGLALIKLVKGGVKGKPAPERGESWSKQTHYKRTVAEFEQKDIGVKCGVELPNGKFLCVLDIDLQNGGNFSYEDLVSDIDFPDTFTVRTGSGGQHFYYASAEPLPIKIDLFQGIDFLAKGSMVVGPSSVSAKNGNIYEIAVDEEIADIPPALEKIVREATKKGPNKKEAFFDGRSQQAIQTKAPLGSRRQYILQWAGSLKRIGYPQHALTVALQALNLAACQPPAPLSDIEKIAASTSGWDIEEPQAQDMPKAEPEKKLKTLRPLCDRLLKKRYVEIYDKAEGLVKDIAQLMLKHCDRPYPELAIAGALSVISACAQGGYRAPALKGRKGSPLSTYFWLLARSSSGKEAFIDAVRTYLDAVNPELRCSVVGSKDGLRSLLWRWNSRISVIDEYQEEMKRLGGPKAGPHLEAILTEMKELVSGKNKLDAADLQRIIWPAVYKPRYSVFGVGTMSGFNEHLTGSIIGDGFISRFAVWPVIGLKKFSEDDEDNRIPEIPKAQLDLLSKIERTGVTQEGKDQDIWEMRKIFVSVGTPGYDPSKVIHVPQNDPDKVQIKIATNAKLKLLDFRNKQQKIFFAFDEKSPGDDEQFSPGSIADRASQFATKVAAIHCLGCDREKLEVNLQDAEFGILVAKTLADWLCSHVSRKAGDSPHDRLCRKLIGKMEDFGGYCNRSKLYKLTGGNMGGRELHAALEAIALSGEIKVYDKATKQEIILDGFLPQKGTFLFKKADDDE